MTLGISGTNLAISMREFDHATPQTQHQTNTSSVTAAQQSILQAKTDTVNFSKDALAKAKEAEKFREKERSEQAAAQKPRGK